MAEANTEPKEREDEVYEDVETQTYGEITWEQFRRYRLAYASMWAVVLLFLVGIYSPAIASDLPFSMTIDGEATYPWLSNLFNKTYYENTVDIIFNAFMFTLPVGVALYLPAAIAAGREGTSRAAARRLKGQAAVAGLVVTIVVCGWVVIDPLSNSSAFGAALWSAIAFAALFGALARMASRVIDHLRGLSVGECLSLVGPFAKRSVATVVIAVVLILALGAINAIFPTLAVVVTVVALGALVATLPIWVVARVAGTRAATVGLALGAIVGVVLGVSVGGDGSDQRPESGALKALGWYEYQYPLNEPELAKLTQLRDEAITGLSGESDGAAVTNADIMTALEDAGFDVSYPPVMFSFRATSTLIDAEVSNAHPLGTDNIGRDNFARMVFGTRIALTIGVVAVGIYITIGIVLGALAGYFGGWVDMLIVRFIEIMLCFPALFLILTLASFVDEPSVFYVVLIIGITRWTGPARLVRGEFLRLRNQEFVQAAKALGLPEWRIIFRHILPNALGPVLVAATFGVASTILVESTISFLGMGDPSAPTWGKILNDGRVFRNTTMILLPGFAIFLTVSLFNLIGEGLRDALDPKMRR